MIRIDEDGNIIFDESFKKLAIVLVPVIFVLIIVFSSVYTVETGYVGVLSRFGRFNMDEIQPGLHFKVPFVDSIKKVDVKVKTLNYTSKPQEAELSGKEGVLYGSPITALDMRGLGLTVELTVQYQLKPTQAAEVLSQYGTNYEMKLIHPIVRDVVRDIIAQYPMEDIPLKRNVIAQTISGTIVDNINKIKGNPLLVTAVQLRRINLDPKIADKIRQVQEAKQEAEKMKALEEKAQREQKVRLIKVETEKQERIKRAEAEQRERILKAEAEKKEKILRAEGEKKANELLSKSITPQLLQWRNLDVQEKMAEAIKSNPNVRLFMGMQGNGNLHFWMDGKK